MPHPHQSFLDEFQFALNHLVPTISDEIKVQAQKIHDDLLANESASEDEIRQSFFEIGFQEYPHRHAYKETTALLGEGTRKDLVLNSLQGVTAALLKKHLEEGGKIDEFVKSEVFEKELDSEQRLEVENAILDTKEKLADILEDEVGAHEDQYQKALAKWQAHADEVLKSITELEALVDRSGKHAGEITNKSKRFREGFLLTEQDPDLEKIQKEIEYWEGVFVGE